MGDYNIKDLRNIALMGHSGAGKTSLAEALLFRGGAIKKMGTVAEGNTVGDYNADEIERKITINSSVMNASFAGKKINIIDTPGYSDFQAETISALTAVEAAIVLVHASRGLEVGTYAAFKLLAQHGTPAAVFVNMMDKERADFGKCVTALQQKYGKKCVVITYPIGKEASFKGAANLLTKEGMGLLQGEERETAEKMIQDLTEAVAESDDALLEKYLDSGEVSAEDLSGALRKAFAAGKIMPIFAGASTAALGVKELLDVICGYFPSPEDAGPIEAVNPANKEAMKVSFKKDGPLSMRVFKTISDPYIGQITIFKVITGTVTTGSNVINATKSEREKAGQINMMQGKEQVAADSLSAGDIGCAAKFKNVSTGDTLCDEKNAVIYPPTAIPEPAISLSIKPRTRSDEDKISTALHRITAEDVAFRAERDAQTKELVVSGMGDLHLNIVISRLKSRYGVEVDIGTPKVAYKETIMGKGDSQYRHKKQSGGAGQFAEVWLKVEPLTRGEGFQFVDDVVGGAIPAQFVVSCEKGVKTAMDAGPLAGFPVVDIRAVVYDGKTHPVDSKDIAFQIAARAAFKDACLKARPVLLEPIMDVEISLPDECMGDITGSLNQHRGRIMGMEPGDGSQVIRAKVPLEEMYKYVNELKSITAGRGTYTMKFDYYEVVPSNLAQAIIEKAKQSKVEEKEE